MTLVNGVVLTRSGGGYRVHTDAGEITATLLQPSLPDVAGHCQALVVEELVQRSQGYVMGRGHGARGQQ